MRIDGSRAVGAYAAVVTLAAVWLALGAVAAPPPMRFDVIDVGRINIREPDGTLRLAISSHARFPGIIVAGHEYPHPGRGEAGMIFYNDEGTENGGLVFDGRWKDGRPTNGGSLTFDRWHQDQTVQLTSSEDGAERQAALIVNDRPDAPMDVGRIGEVAAMPPGAARDAAIRSANFGNTQRAYLGRAKGGEATLVLRDGAGRARLTLAVGLDGKPEIRFLDAAGRVTRRVS